MIYVHVEVERNLKIVTEKICKLRLKACGLIGQTAMLFFYF